MTKPTGMALRSETRANLRMLAEFEPGFTVAELEQRTGWSNVRARKVLERLEDAGLLTVELVYIYVMQPRPATERRRAATARVRRKVKHYSVAEHAFEKMKESEREQVGTEYAGKPRRIISSVFDLGLHA